MSQSSLEVRLAPFGRVLRADVGTAYPATVTDPFSASWRDLGFTDEDGVSITPSIDVSDINAWQSLTPVKQTLTGMNVEVAFKLIQVNQATTSMFFLGETWTASGGNAEMILSSNPGINEEALAIEWTDDASNTNRLIFPRGLVTDREELVLSRNDEIQLGITYRALDSNGVVMVMHSNDPNLQFS